MTPTHTRSARQIQRLARLLAFASLIFMITLPLALLIFWSSANDAELARIAGLAPQAVPVTLATWQHIAGACISGFPMLALILGLRQARNCFKLFAEGTVFSTQAIHHLRRFAGWIMVSLVLGLCAGPALSVLLTANNPPGMHQLAVGIGSNQVFTLFFAGMVWLMAAVIGEGQSLAEENDSFV